MNRRPMPSFGADDDPGGSAAIAQRVVGQYPGDGDLASGEPGHRARQEPSTGVHPLVEQDLDVGRPDGPGVGRCPGHDDRR
jgi:hypothetical protein